MILSIKNKRLLWLSYSIFNLFLIGTFLISSKKELILFLVPVLFFIAGFTDKRKQFIKQFIGFCLRVVPFILFLYLYWIVHHLPIEYIQNLTLFFSLPAIAISAVFNLIGNLLHRMIKSEHLKTLWFISILALLLGALSGAVRNWQVQGILLSLIYFTAGLLVANKDGKFNIRNYLVLTGPFIMLFASFILIDQLWHIAFFPVYALIASFMGFLVRQAVSDKKTGTYRNFSLDLRIVYRYWLDCFDELDSLYFCKAV